MLVYLRVDMVDDLRPYIAYNTVSMAPSYVWRYTNYAEGVNFIRTYVHRGMMYSNGVSLSLGVF